MRVAYFPQDTNASGMYRCVFPFRELEARGHYCRTPFHRSLGRDKRGSELRQFVMETTPVADVYVFQQPLDSAWLSMVKDLRRAGKVTVGETDDSGVLPDWHPSFEGTSVDNNAARNREWRRRVFQACDALTCPTEALAEEWAPRVSSVRVLPNFLLLEMWQRVTPQCEVERPGGRVRVGWMGKGFWRHGDLRVLKPVIRPFLERNPHVDFVAAGDGLIHDMLGVPLDRRVVYQGVEFPRGMAQLTATMDIGLVPLALDTPEERQFNNSKSNLKGMEYAACGIPSVCSASRPYQSWLEDGETGFLVRRPEDWGSRLDTLVRDPGLRRRMGRAARHKVGLHGIADHAHLWSDFYQELLDRKARQSTWGKRKGVLV